MSAEYYFCDVMYYSCTSYFSCTEQKIVVWTNTLFQEAEAAFAGRLCDYNSWDRGSGISIAEIKLTIKLESVFGSVFLKAGSLFSDCCGIH